MKQRDFYRASRSASYIYGSAAPDLREQESFEVLPGHRRAAAIAAAPSSMHSVAFTAIVVMAVVALICCVVLTFHAWSMAAANESSALSSQIETARSVGNDLAVQQSQLSNSMHVKLAAEGLGMSTPVATEAVTLSADVVATDASGNLSLSGSLSAMAAQG